VTGDMTERDRFLAVMRFQPVDRVPFTPGHGRRSTREAWYTQGLPADVKDYHVYIRDLLGIPHPPPQQRVNPGASFTMIPEFEEKVLEHRPSQAAGAPGVLVVQDWKGNVCEIADTFSPSDLRGAPDFVTRSWIRCPVESRADWADMARRYNLDDPGRFPEDFKQRCAKLRGRDYPVGLVFPGPFWQLREWLGFENLCMLLLDDPAFAQEMIDFWQRFVTAMFERIFQDFVPDYITFNEDMAYKEKPMIGPAMCRQFLLPCWSAWVAQARSAGVPILEIDSDGCTNELIPVWLQAGMNSVSPMEVAAGNDLPALRRQYGQAIAFRGGVDKRKMAVGGQAIRHEIARLQPVIDSGGYIPGCDHGVPSDVSWPNFLDYCRLLAEATGWIKEPVA
jgi:uroporphyrinogen-III decarboxylase